MLTDRILFIDAEAMVIDKPAGLPVDAPRDGALAVANHLDSLRLGFQRRPAIMHRLDRDTSGCLLLARNPKAQRRFAAAFEAGTVRKEYLAVLDGVPAEADGRVALALAKVSSAAAGWRMVPDVKGKAAATAWRVLAVVGGRALVRFLPETGRTHQLRVHAASGIGVPILGDPVYGRGAGSPSTGAGQKMMLHAHRIDVPRGDKPPVAAEAPLPPAFAEFAAAYARAVEDAAA